jgi:FtsH-binding integral membrane protein
VCVFSYYYKPFYNFQIEHWWVSLIFVGIVVILSILIECTSCGRQHPQNMILLLVFVLCFSYILSYTTSYYAYTYGGQIVIEACAITMAILIALTAYAFFTRTDFTTWVGIVIVIVVCFSFFGVSVAVRWNKTLNSLYCALGAILAGILLIIDTQMIVGGERSFKISMDDYVFGALVIYVDVIRLFIYILRGLASKKKK